MNTSSSPGGAATRPGVPAASPPARSRVWNGATIGTVATVLSLLVAVLAWQWPRSPSEPAGVAGPASVPAPGVDTSPEAVSPNRTPTATATKEPPTQEPATEGSAAEGPAANNLDSIAAEAGGADLVSVPRQVRDKEEYQPHPVAIDCPSNEADDQENSVTWPLRGGYLGLLADVRPYYPGGVRSATYVTVLIGVRERDGSLTTTEAGRQLGATPARPAGLTATLDNAEKLTVRVQCEDPGGTVVLTGARLTPAQ